MSGKKEKLNSKTICFNPTLVLFVFGKFTN